MKKPLKLVMELLPFILLSLALLLRHPTDKGTVERHPSWIELTIAKHSLEPAREPYEIWRYRYRGADAYYFPGRCCDIPSAVYDANGTGLGALSGGLIVRPRDPRLWDFPTTGGTLVWKSDPDTQGPVAARAILQDPRFSKELALLAFAHLEVDTGVPWIDFEMLSFSPILLRAATAPLVTTSAGMAPEQVAMNFLVRYKVLFGMVEPASDLVLAPTDPRPFPRSVRFSQKVNGVVVNDGGTKSNFSYGDTDVDFNERGSVVAVRSWYSRD